MKKTGSSAEKTNAMRLLDAAKISYGSVNYEQDPKMSGEDIAKVLGEDPGRVFKTLVTEGKSGAHYVFVIPVSEELDLKKAAKAASEKSIAMIKQKDLLPLTGYIHGGCSPIGMKKAFPTFLHETAILYDDIYVSGGRLGCQICISSDDLTAIAGCVLSDITSGG